ncbi:hypothetical protein ACFFRR_004224 [Megaselia abdita]
MSGNCDILVTGFVGFLESSLSGIFLVVPLYLLNERYHVDHHDLEEVFPKYLRYFIWYTLCSIGFWMVLLIAVLKEKRPLFLPWMIFQIVVMFFDLIKNVFLLFECLIQIHLFIDWNAEFTVLIIATIFGPLYFWSYSTLALLLSIL